MTIQGHNFLFVHILHHQEWVSEYGMTLWTILWMKDVLKSKLFLFSGHGNHLQLQFIPTPGISLSRPLPRLFRLSDRMRKTDVFLYGSDLFRSIHQLIDGCHSADPPRLRQDSSMSP